MRYLTQPIELDEKGVVRFKANGIITFLFQTGKLNLNELSALLAQGAFSKEDYAQITQLLGYSVSGWGDLSTSPEELVQAADAEADLLLSGKREKYVEKAREWCLDVREGEIELEVDDDARTSKADGGCWVQGWIWVPEEEVGPPTPPTVEDDHS